jgi:hypothetical protein
MQIDPGVCGGTCAAKDPMPIAKLATASAIMAMSVFDMAASPEAEEAGRFGDGSATRSRPPQIRTEHTPASS